MSSNDITEQIVDGFMRYVRMTPHLENVSITVAYATKLCQRIKAAHKCEVEKLRGEIAGLREKMGDDDLLKMARDIEKMAREIAAKDAEIDCLRGELKRVYRVLWNCASAGWECENCRRDCQLHKMGIVKMPEG